MKFDLTILGCGAATPTLKRNPTAQLLNVHDKLFLIDCAEGTQLQLRRYKIKFQKINQIFISHLHGDHYLGLIGLMSSMHLLGRKKKLQIFGPPGLDQLIQQNLQLSDTWLNYEWDFKATSDSEKELLLEDNTLRIYSFPLKHRIHCAGFLFEEKHRKPKVKKEYINRYELGIVQIKDLKNSEDVELENGDILKAEDATIPAIPPRSYAYCSDTAFYPKLAEFLESPDLIYHEATFLEEHATRAKETFHSTAGQAAQIAAMLGAKKLLLGHYSSRYTDLGPFIEEASEHFKYVALANDGLLIQISS